eukprot:Skav234548  [mRNA]  locus=scaffold2556:318150:323031:+ [translate_table: standard]
MESSRKRRVGEELLAGGIFPKVGSLVRCQALRRLYDAQVLLQSYEEQLSSKDEQLQSIMACVKKASNGSRYTGNLSNLRLAIFRISESITTTEQRPGGKMARFEARVDGAFEAQKWEEQQDRDRKAREMQEVTGGLSIPASPQSAYGEHELNWFKIPYWLKGDEETRRAIIHNMKQHFVDEMNSKAPTWAMAGHFDHNIFQEHLWQAWSLACGLQVAQRWAGVPNQELQKQAEAPPWTALESIFATCQETSMLRQHIKRVERKYKELQSNVGKMQKAMSTMAGQLKEALLWALQSWAPWPSCWAGQARETAAMHGVELPPPHEAERRPSVPIPCGLKLIQGSFKDVQIKSRSIQELSDVAVQWLGSPGAWQLATVANWPLTDEALQRPTTERSPLVVHVWNSQDRIRRIRFEVFLRKMEPEEDVDKRLKDMDGEIDKKAGPGGRPMANSLLNALRKVCKVMAYFDLRLKCHKVENVQEQGVKIEVLLLWCADIRMLRVDDTVCVNCFQAVQILVLKGVSVESMQEYMNQTLMMVGSSVDVSHKTQAQDSSRRVVDVQSACDIIVVAVDSSLVAGRGDCQGKSILSSNAEVVQLVQMAASVRPLGFHGKSAADRCAERFYALNLGAF